jgi:hypothetical protein
VLFLKKNQEKKMADWGGDSSGAVCAVESRIAIPVSGEEKSC